MEAGNEMNPGATMRQRREERDLSLEDVAKSLNLTTRVINAIEENDFKKLPGITYTRGYIRNYAHLLDLAPEPLLDALMLKIKDETQEIVEALPPEQENQNNSRTVMLGTIVVGAIIIGLSIVWWQGQEREPSRPMAVNMTSTAADEGNPAASSDSLPAAGNKRVAGTESRAKGEKSTDKSIPGMPAGESSDPFVAVMQGPGDVKASKKIIEFVTGERTAKKPDSKQIAGEASTKTVEENKVAKIKPVRRLRVVLQAREASWADIRDARNNKLLYETVAAGRVVTIEGDAPFSVFLGNPDGVDIVLDGKRYNISQHKQGLVARFKLGAQTQ